jgi:uncharacterized protein (DUF1800 family)
VNTNTPYRPTGTLEIATALQTYAGAWNPRLAAHLLRRAGFGGSPADAVRLERLSMNAAVDGLVHFPADAGLPEQPDDLPDWSQYLRTLRDLRTGQLSPQAALQMAAAQPLVSGVPMQPAMAAPADAGEARKAITRRFVAGSIVSLQRWWLSRMLKTPAPLQEKMTLFWHGHFTSEVLNKGTSPPDMVAQNQLFRRFALGNVRDLTQAVARDPAMLRYLDNARSDRAHPNENFARELMELFTLGIGNYTEQDVRESARAFTGWTLQRGGFYEDRRKHDDESKTFLGRSGNFDGGDIIGIIFEQRAAPRWFARKLLEFFVYDEPEPELIDATAALIRKNDFKLEPVLSTLLRSNVFYSDRAYRALVKSPVEFVVGAHQLFGVQEIAPETLAALRRMGQFLFRPPNVKGWDGGVAWLNSQTVLTRENFASALMGSQAMPQQSWLTSGMPLDARGAAARLVATILQGDASSASLGRLVAYLDGAGTSTNAGLSGENLPERIRGAAYLTMAMPAYQLA